MNEMLTTKELSEMLRLNEKKVYQLVRDGNVPRVRIAGKWLFPRNHITRWIDENVERERDISIAGSDDVLLSRLLARYSRENLPEALAFYAPVGSIAGIHALVQGKCQACCAHILDLETGEYNIPYVKRHLGDHHLSVIALWRRKQGLIVKAGNPKGIKGIRDLAAEDVRFVGRNKESGTAVLFEYLVRQEGLNDNNRPRNTGTVDSHMETAMTVFFEEADCGLGIEYVTHPLGLEFIPLKDERFDLVIPGELVATAPMKRFIEFLEPSSLSKLTRNIPGYDVREAGKIIYSQ
ncbi:MAG: helix-turn-helix transcriptional regulator [Syntrophales bacterium]|jgi:excisionase family DNA binding protein|nr:helix-turn-helix transcriptional regulator [Syntrophales bacterium]MCK9528523.1 helix-turn-helix transcriptional regulator [Syntrophales bacterium]MDX9922850.1 helix-turn-helix transcriptional regulator [Syntrophales bacterium]